MKVPTEQQMFPMGILLLCFWIAVTTALICVLHLTAADVKGSVQFFIPLTYLLRNIFKNCLICQITPISMT